MKNAKLLLIDGEEVLIMKSYLPEGFFAVGIFFISNSTLKDFTIKVKLKSHQQIVYNRLNKEMLKELIVLQTKFHIAVNTLKEGFENENN